MFGKPISLEEKNSQNFATFTGSLLTFIIIIIIGIFAYPVIQDSLNRRNPIVLESFEYNPEAYSMNTLSKLPVIITFSGINEENINHENSIQTEVYSRSNDNDYNNNSVVLDKCSIDKIWALDSLHSNQSKFYNDTIEAYSRKGLKTWCFKFQEGNNNKQNGWKDNTETVSLKVLKTKNTTKGTEKLNMKIEYLSTYVTQVHSKNSSFLFNKESITQPLSINDSNKVTTSKRLVFTVRSLIITKETGWIFSNTLIEEAVEVESIKEESFFPSANDVLFEIVLKNSTLIRNIDITHNKLSMLLTQLVGIVFVVYVVFFLLSYDYISFRYKLHYSLYSNINNNKSEPISESRSQATQTKVVNETILDSRRIKNNRTPNDQQLKQSQLFHNKKVNESSYFASNKNLQKTNMASLVLSNKKPSTENSKIDHSRGKEDNSESPIMFRSNLAESPFLQNPVADSNLSPSSEKIKDNCGFEQRIPIVSSSQDTLFSLRKIVTFNSKDKDLVTVKEDHSKNPIEEESKEKGSLNYENKSSGSDCSSSLSNERKIGFDFLNQNREDFRDLVQEAIQNSKKKNLLTPMSITSNLSLDRSLEVSDQKESKTPTEYKERRPSLFNSIEYKTHNQLNQVREYKENIIVLSEGDKAKEDNSGDFEVNQSRVSTIKEIQQKEDSIHINSPERNNRVNQEEEGCSHNHPHPQLLQPSTLNLLKEAKLKAMSTAQINSNLNLKVNNSNLFDDFKSLSYYKFLYHRIFYLCISANKRNPVVTLIQSTNKVTVLSVEHHLNLLKKNQYWESLLNRLIAG